MVKNKFVKRVGSWHENRSQTVTIVVTDDCNLRCKYCYITHKCSDNVMEFETARRFIDRLLTSDEMRSEESLILEFIGGEPLIEVDLIDRVTDYFKRRAFELDHDWYWNYRISICSNGVNYGDPKVQRYIRKNDGKLSLSITLDGIKAKHDMNRVFPDGTGSHDTILKNIPLWLTQFPGSTKVTFASDDLPLLYESILYLWSIGIKEVNANVVFENVWKDGDDEIFEAQLKKLADYMIEHRVYEDGCYTSLFEEYVGNPYLKEDMDKTSCGAGKMLALAPNGNLYPCIRYYGYSLNNHEEKVIGTIDTGVDMEKVRPFVLATNRVQSDEECKNCEIATGCSFCQGFNYDDSESGTNFYRSKYICKMHKARVRANQYFFARLYNEENMEKEYDYPKKKTLHFLMDDGFTNYCSYDNSGSLSDGKMGNDILRRGLEYSAYHFYQPILVHSKENEIPKMSDYSGYDIFHIVPIERVEEVRTKGWKRMVATASTEDYSELLSMQGVILWNVRVSEIKDLYDNALRWFQKTDRIHLNILPIRNDFPMDSYRHELEKIAEFIRGEWKRGRKVEFNVLTDPIFLEEHDHCKAGDTNFVLSPTGELYECCAFYKEGIKTSIGNLDAPLSKSYDMRLYRMENHNLCSFCDAYQCPNCVYLNMVSTGEVNVSPSFQCKKSVLEKRIAEGLRSTLRPLAEGEEKSDISYVDPMERFLEKTAALKGYYKSSCDL